MKEKHQKHIQKSNVNSKYYKRNKGREEERKGGSMKGKKEGERHTSYNRLKLISLMYEEHLKIYNGTINCPEKWTKNRK